MAITVGGTTITFNDGTTQNTAAASWGTWQNVATSRALSTTYTNSTGRPIFVAVACRLNAGGNTSTFLVNGGVALYTRNVFNDRSVDWTTFTMVIPNGNTYQVTSGGSILYWWELR